MNRFVLLLACSLLLGACTAVDLGVGRGASSWETDFDANAYFEMGWTDNDSLLAVDIVGGSNAYSLVSVDIWRLLHLEVGLLGVGLGIGPLQFGAGFGLYAPVAPATLGTDQLFHCDDDPLDP